ncbi:MAG: alpha/beta hydrolase [Acidobacteria bacterium]|nr:alpha/beta hydrolase [Acidobacteriota bacterium]
MHRIFSFRSLSLAFLAMTLGVVPAGAATKPTIVLVHGAFVDGSGWAGVHRILREQGYQVVVVQHAAVSLAEDVAAVRRAIAGCEGDVVLVGHSYGGVVITEAGTDAKVMALVYVAAFAPDRGESVASMNEAAPPGAPKPPILAPKDGFLLLDKAQFRAAFAADVPVDVARFMADAQLPWGLQALTGAISDPAWKAKPSWYLIPEDDRMIPADAQRAMAGRAHATVRTVPGSHAIYVSNPAAVAKLIAEAATAKKVAPGDGRE